MVSFYLSYPHLLLETYLQTSMNRLLCVRDFFFNFSYLIELGNRNHLIFFQPQSITRPPNHPLQFHPSNTSLPTLSHISKYEQKVKRIPLAAQDDH